MTETAIDRPGDTGTVIRAAGLKVTAQRLAVLDVLTDAPHSSAEQVLAALQERSPGISSQAVYGILAAFTTAGLVRRIASAGSPARYECRVGDNHHHLVCVDCGHIQDVDCVIGEAPCLSPADDAGFTILSAEVTFVGLCGTCGTRASVSPALTTPEASPALTPTEASQTLSTIDTGTTDTKGPR